MSRSNIHSLRCFVCNLIILTSLMECHPYHLNAIISKNVIKKPHIFDTKEPLILETKEPLILETKKLHFSEPQRPLILETKKLHFSEPQRPLILETKKLHFSEPQRSHNLNNGASDALILSYHDVKPPDHLEAVRMERDGHLNKKFSKEIFIGSVNKSVTADEKLLSSVHYKADVNKDGFLSQFELEDWIIHKVKEHFKVAVHENLIIFTALDKDHNGRVSWDEYHTNFMIEQGFNKSYAKKHAENHRNLERKVKERILLDKAAWSEAANSDPEALNIDEFLTFRHPEHSHVSLINMVNDIITSLDENGDEKLSEQEFVSMPDPDETNHSTAEWKMLRIQEFRENIDINQDGKVTREELLMYNDPENPVHSRTEAKRLIKLADTDGDEKLSLAEVLAKKEFFLGSKMIDTARSFHDEF